MYQPEFWREVRPVIHCRAIRSWSSASGSTCISSSTATSSESNQSITNSSFSNNEKNMEVNSNNAESSSVTEMTTSPVSSSSSHGDQMKQNFFNSLKQRGFDTICLLNANDADIFDFIQNFPHGATGIHSLILRCCNISDRGLEAIMEFLQVNNFSCLFGAIFD